MNGVTDWFPAQIKPTRVGWYEVGHNKPVHWNSRGRLTGRPFRYWNGREWRVAAPSEKWARGLGPSVFGSHPSHQWRGLTERSK